MARADRAKKNTAGQTGPPMRLMRVLSQPPMLRIIPGTTVFFRWFCGRCNPYGSAHGYRVFEPVYLETAQALLYFNAALLVAIFDEFC